MTLGSNRSIALAVAPRGAKRIAADELTALPGAGVGKPLRRQMQLRAGDRSTVAWRHFTSRRPGAWQAAWDAATGVPARIWGTGIPAAGANASPAIAETFARRVLAEHLALLAPGAAFADFVLVSNHSDGDIRSIGFTQWAAGRRVVGGQLSFRFKRDRLFVIASEALPHVRVESPNARLAPRALHARVETSLRATLDLPRAPVVPVPGEVVLPLIADDDVLGYRVAARAEIDGGIDGRYLAYVDPSSGAVIALHQQNLFATGTLQYKSVDRHPGRPRVDRPARRARVTVGATPQTTTSDGKLTWTPETPQMVTTSVLGDLVTVANKAMAGTLATTELSLAPNGVALWDASADEHQDAQVQAFLATNRVKDFIRVNLDPAMPGLDAPFAANVNIEQSCNAFFDGESINFFVASMRCENTALLEDVVFHEFGHALHVAQIIEGVGGFDGAMSEGVSDFLAAIITNDSGMGRGFFRNDEALRDIDPADLEYRWPEDIKAIHHTGLIYGGAFWDLRKSLIAARGEVAGTALVNKLFLATIRRAVSIPTSLIEALAADDNDGDLANGTPNECAIREAFGRHGLRTVTGVARDPGPVGATTGTARVRVELSGISTRCTGDDIAGITLEWKPGVTGAPAAGSAALLRGTDGTYEGDLPLATDDTVSYLARVAFADGSAMVLADNLADPYYQLYRGDTVPLYCTSFDDDPFANGWAHGASADMTSPWSWGAAVAGPTDPPQAFSGTHVLTQQIGGNYVGDASSFARLPTIDVGQWSDVRLQYRRWLAVEDGHFDQARVTVGGREAWTNFNSDQGDSSSIHHVDREWRFHDVALSPQLFGRTLDVAFTLDSDQGLHLGGWAIDDLCVVANVNSVCGDGVKSAAEQCDDGDANVDAPGACRTYCKLPACGDGILDDGEGCDRGFEGDATCSATCETMELEPAGCCSSSTPSTGFLLAGLVGALFVWPRRPRRRSERRITLGASARSRAARSHPTMREGHPRIRSRPLR